MALDHDSFDWMKLILKSSEKVQNTVKRIQSHGARTKVVGTGASGDKTLLADREAEKILVDALSKVSGVRILSEESGEIGQRGAELLAIVDPLDGSSNFERRIPFYCTSIAIVRGRRLADTRAALVRNLVTGDVYYAERGKGATKNGERIATSETSNIREAILGVDLSRTDEGTYASLARLITSAKRQVHFGANALELCFLAEGMIDAFIDVRNKTRIVDFAGGYLIAKEAGAVLSTKSGDKLLTRLEMKERFSFVSSANPQLQKVILDALKQRHP